MITILKFTLCWLLYIHLLVMLSFLPPKDATNFLCDHHQWPKCFLQTCRHCFEEIIRGKETYWLQLGLLEHVLPDLVCCHEEAETYRLYWDIGRLSKYLRMLQGILLFDFSLEFSEVGGIESCLLGFEKSMRVDWRMMAEPKFHQRHKDLPACKIGIIQMIRLFLPFLP